MNEDKLHALELTIVKHEGQLTALNEWRLRSNEILQGLEKKLDDMRLDMAHERQATMRWMVGILGGIITALVLLIVNLTIIW